MNSSFREHYERYGDAVTTGSHQINLHADTPGLPHSQWLERMKAFVDKYRDQISAPALKKGDVLFWNSRTIQQAVKRL